MPSSLVDESNKSEATTAVPSDRAAEKLLVAAAKAGDEQALEILFKRYQRRIFALALRYTRVREDAEDIVQQTFKKAFVYLQHVRREILVRDLVNAYRHQSGAYVAAQRPFAARGFSRRFEQRQWNKTPRWRLPIQVPTRKPATCSERAARNLSAAVEQLTPAMRAAFELRELLELSTRETAQRMGTLGRRS